MRPAALLLLFAAAPVSAQSPAAKPDPDSPAVKRAEAALAAAGGRLFGRGTPAGRVRLVGPGVTDATLEHLKPLDGLYPDVAIEAAFGREPTAPAVTDAGLAVLAGMSGLVRLELSECEKVTDAGVKSLARLPRLVHLGLNRCPQLTDACLTHVAGMGRLRSLGLLGLNLTGDGLAHLKRLRLERLYLQLMPKFDPENFRYLADLPNLELLYVYGTPIGPGGARTIGGLTQLKRLELARGGTPDRGGVTDDDLKSLRGLTNLEALILSNSDITDAGLAHLSGLTNLSDELRLDNTPVTDAGARHLLPLTRLRSLQLSYTQVGDAGIVALAGAMPRLEYLGLGGTRVTDAGLAALAGCPDLVWLSLDNVPVTDAGVARLHGLKKLERLVLSGTRVTDAGVAGIAEAMPALEELSLNDTAVTDKGLASLHDLKELKSVHLYGAKAVTPAGVAALKAAIPGVRVNR